jgi:molybdate transport system ATP-binding protein
VGGVAVAVTLRAKLFKRFGSGFTLDIASEFGPGFHVLFGPSGAGKTTILDCLAGLTAPDSGNILLADRTLFDTETQIDIPTHKRRVGYVLQSQGLFPHLTVRRNIAFGFMEREDPSVSILMKDLEIADFEDRKPVQLSAGQRQRVALARSLVTNPRYLLMDEPLAALDAVTKSTIIDVLRKWNEQHQVPVLYVTHDRDEAYSLGEHLLVIEEGKVVASGSPQEVMTAPVRNTIAQLAGFENLLKCEKISDHPDQGTMTCRISGTEVAMEAPLTRVAGREVTLGIRAGDILIAAERPQEISARNVLLGRVEAIEIRGVLVRLLVNVKGAIFEAHVTPAAQVALRLSGGKSVWLVIKTYSCHLLSSKS